MPWEGKQEEAEVSPREAYKGDPRELCAYLVGALLTLLFIQAIPCHFGQDRIQGVILQVQPLQALKRRGGETG